MEDREESTLGHWPTTHEYPDPDYAAHVTKYPWVGHESNDVELNLPDGHGVAWRDISQRSSRSNFSVALDNHLLENADAHSNLLTIVDSLDADYQTTDDAIL